VSFVKDDHGYTRGVGAVASMDAASPGRRLAAARAARELARRDALMAASTMGRAPLVATSLATKSFGARSIEVDHFGRGSGGLKQPSGPSGGGRLPPKPLPPRPLPPRKPPRGPLFDYRAGRMVKSPGSVIDAEPTKGTAAPITGATKGATKEPVRSYGGGGGGGGSSGGGSSANVGPLEPLPSDVPAEEEEAPAAPAAPAAPPKTSSNLLLYAAIGVAGWWLLTRK
jgi:hypothetical protein